VYFFIYTPIVNYYIANESNRTISTGDGFFFIEEASLCPPKPKKARTRADIAKAGIALYKKKRGKK